MSDITKADKVYVSTSKNGDYVSAVDDGDSVTFIRADLVPQWQPIETYDGKDFFVLISDGKYWTLGVKRKHWHDTTEGDYLVTSPMNNQPKYWMPSAYIIPPPAT